MNAPMTEDKAQHLGVVIDAFDNAWYLYEIATETRRSTWLPATNPDADPESWTKVNGNYGPAREWTP